MAYRFDGKQKTLAFGSYPIVTLAEAREKRDTAKRLMADGADPSQQVKLEKIRRKVSSASTFNAVADEFLAKAEREGKAEATLTKKRWLLGFARRHFGDRPISENTLNGALRRLGFAKSEATSHGFRASASSLLNESGKWHADAIEAELGHLGADQVRRAYHRAACRDERARMTEWRADEIAAMLGIA